jgi:hypothetical protein
MPNYKPKPVSHRALARRTTDLNASVDEAIDALETATRRERVLTDGEAERRNDIATTYPAIHREH